MTLSIEDFGSHLLKSGDLDPVYNALWEGLKHGELHPDDAKRWMVAYWCLYHCGSASFIAEHRGREFWQLLDYAARNVPDHPPPIGERWPRGHERRHWRGENAKKSLHHLYGRYKDGPEKMVDALIHGASSYKSLTTLVESHVGFGPWMAFKIADMMERIMVCNIDFTTPDVFMFKDPEEAALMVWRQKMGLPDNARPKDKKTAINGVVNYLVDYFKDYEAPPRFDRPVGLQEVETILCKWKSHRNGHYPLNNDIIDISKGLTLWEPVSHIAGVIHRNLPQPLKAQAGVSFPA